MMMPFVDLTAARAPYTFKNDSHWNEAGNQLAAVCLYRFLEREMGLPRLAEDELREALYRYYSAFGGLMPDQYRDEESSSFAARTRWYPGRSIWRWSTTKVMKYHEGSEESTPLVSVGAPDGRRDRRHGQGSPTGSSMASPTQNTPRRWRRTSRCAEPIAPCLFLVLSTRFMATRLSTPMTT